MNPSYRLVLSAECKVCHNMTYSWQLNTTSASNTVKRLLPADTLHGLREPVINVNPHVFASHRSETYVINLSGQLIDSYYQQQNCSPINVPFSDVQIMLISQGVPLLGIYNQNTVGKSGHFQPVNILQTAINTAMVTINRQQEIAHH